MLAILEESLFSEGNIVPNTNNLVALKTKLNTNSLNEKKKTCINYRYIRKLDYNIQAHYYG